MHDCVMNEYVHVDYQSNDINGTIVAYEPLDSLAARDTIRGKVFFEGDCRPTIAFRHGRNYLLVDSDDVIFGSFTDNAVCLIWKGIPPNHFLCVSYDVAVMKPLNFSWIKEGF